MDRPVQVITTFGRLQAGLFALIMLAFSALCIWTLASGVEATRRYSPEMFLVVLTGSAVLFGGGGLLSFAQIFKPGRLLLFADGFKLVGLWSLPFLRWADVETFDAVSFSPLRKSVCFRLTLAAMDANHPRPLWMRVAPRGFHGLVFSGLPGAADRVLETIQDVRLRHS